MNPKSNFARQTWQSKEKSGTGWRPDSFRHSASFMACMHAYVARLFHFPARRVLMTFRQMSLPGSPRTSTTLEVPSQSQLPPSRFCRHNVPSCPRITGIYHDPALKDKTEKKKKKQQSRTHPAEYQINAFSFLFYSIGTKQDGS